MGRSIPIVNRDNPVQRPPDTSIFLDNMIGEVLKTFLIGTGDKKTDADQRAF